MKRKALALILALVLVFGLIPGTAFAAAKPIELTVWAGFDEMTWLNAQLDAFESANPQWSITWNIVEYEAYESREMLLQDPTTGADVFFFGDDWLQELVWYDVLMPLSQEDAALIREQTSQAVYDAVTDQSGQFYGFPLSADTILLYYNKKIYSEEDVKSLDTMIEKAPVAYPLNLGTDVAAFYLANGCTMFGADGKNESAGFRFNGARGTAATLWLADFIRHENFRNDVDSLGHWGLWQGELGASFLNYEAYDLLYEIMGDDLGVAPLPAITIDGQTRQMPAHTSTYCVGVNRHTDQADAALALARFLTSAESQLLRWELYQFPSSPTYPIASELINDPAVQAHGGVRTHLQTLDSIAYHTPTFYGMSLLWQYSDLLTRWMINGEITPENAAERTEEWNTLLNGGVMPPTFSDVPAGAYYEDAVEWAVVNGITSGTSATTFSPGDDCMRAYAVTFLWRVAGCPEPRSTVNPFVDVAPGSFYEKPVLWALEQGITTGTDATHFNPAGVCNRAQIVTFLYRAFGSPAVDTNDLPFTDVPADSWCAAPVAWALENDITKGLSDTSFGPEANCIRAQVVTFLYRAYN
ncbi:MAG: extracellular solute-binding protein [Oscillospiraceae bacterium]|nr:extracellular solute-binding protein [Oscillospiraceae bacterium]